jgi:hypothetical protein
MTHYFFSMKLEFLDGISDRGKYPQVISERLVRLYDFNPNQTLLLKDAIQKNIIDIRKEINLSSLWFIDGVDCGLAFQISDEEIGLAPEGRCVV